MADDDEQWLYGDSNAESESNQDSKKNGLDNLLEDGETTDKTIDEQRDDDNDSKEAGEVGAGEGEDDGEPREGEDGEENGELPADGEEDSDEDEDNVNVVIGDITKAAPTYTNLNIHKRGGMVPAGKSGAGKFSMDDFESVGIINGVSAVDYNFEVLEDKPWRKPGADITDYFNYGFNEDTWKAYCDRQRRIRVNESGVGLPTTPGGPTPSTIPTVQPPPSQKRGPWDGGSEQIHVIGGRRPDETPQPIPPMGIPPPNFRPMPPGPRYNEPSYDQPYYGPEYSHFDGGPGGPWRESWPPSNIIAPPHPKDSLEMMERDRRRSPGRDRDRERDRERDMHREREREKDREREERERRERYRRSRSRSHARERSRDRSKARSRTRSPSHKKHKKKSKKGEKSDKKKRSDESE